MASAGVKWVTCQCDKLLGNPVPQVWIWASTIGMGGFPFGFRAGTCCFGRCFGNASLDAAPCQGARAIQRVRRRRDADRFNPIMNQTPPRLRREALSFQSTGRRNTVPGMRICGYRNRDPGSIPR